MESHGKQRKPEGRVGMVRRQRSVEMKDYLHANV